MFCYIFCWLHFTYIPKYLFTDTYNGGQRPRQTKFQISFQTPQPSLLSLLKDSKSYCKCNFHLRIIRWISLKFTDGRFTWCRHRDQQSPRLASPRPVSLVVQMLNTKNDSLNPFGTLVCTRGKKNFQTHFFWQFSFWLKSMTSTVNSGYFICVFLLLARKEIKKKGSKIGINSHCIISQSSFGWNDLQK